MQRSASWFLPVALAVLSLPIPLSAQGPRGARTSQGAAINPATDPVLRGFRWRSIGPVGQGGRIDDIAVVENEPRVFYLGYATGGVWKTVNAGVTFEPIFETYGSASIGAIAVSQTKPDIVYVGTGEGNGRNSSSFGDCVYKSTDAGRTFTH